MRAGVLVFALALVPGAVGAQERRCEGRDPTLAERERQRAREAFARAMRRPGYVDHEALRAAIDAATAACAAGEDRGLALRAAARHAGGDDVQAARDLDAYLARHPVAQERDPEVERYLRELAAAIDGGVARVRVARPPWPLRELRVGDVTLADDAREVALAPGDVEVRGRADGFDDAVTSLRLRAGERVELTVREAGAGASAPSTLAMTRRAAPPAPPPRPDHPLRPWAIGATVAGGALLATAVGLFAWRESEAGTYRALGCEATPVSQPACVDRYGRLSDAGSAALGTLVAGASIAAAAGALWFLDLRAARRRAWWCAPLPAGGACGLRF